MRTVQPATDTDAGLMTREGFDRLKGELEQLSGDGRRLVADRLREARLDGVDPVENGELMDALEELGRLEQRIGAIEGRLAGARIAAPGRAGCAARVGTRVRLTNPRRGVLEFTLVGAGEADLTRGRISIDSPMGQAVVGQRSGDTVEVQTPRRRLRFRIVSVDAERARRGDVEARAA